MTLIDLLGPCEVCALPAITSPCTACRRPRNDGALPTRASRGRAQMITTVATLTPTTISTADTPCPHCHAGPGQPCRPTDGRGYVIGAQHIERVSDGPTKHRPERSSA